MLKLLFFLNELQSFLNFFLHFLSFVLGVLHVYLLHVIFESLFKCFFLGLFLRYEIIYKLLRRSQSFFVIIMNIFHVIVLAEILARGCNRTFLKYNPTKSWKSIWKVMRHLRSSNISWCQTLIFILKRVIWISSALNIKRFLKNIHSPSYKHLIISYCFLFLCYNLLTDIAIIRIHQWVMPISFFWNLNLNII